MSFKIADFLNNLDTYGKASPNKFMVNINVPPIMVSMINQGKLIIPVINTMYDTSIKYISYRAETINVPGIDMSSIETNSLGIGPTIKQPFNAVLSDADITFINDDKGLLEGFFHLWMNLIYNFAEDNNATTNATYFTNYRSDVCSNIQIFKYDDYGNLINTYGIINALPTLVSPMEYSWNNRNALSKIRVKFHYTNFAIN